MAAPSVGQIGLDLVVNRKSFDKQMNGIQSLAKKTAGILAACFAVKKIVDFGKSCIELGSDLSEVQNVVDTVFPAMSKRMEQFSKDAIGTYGLSEKVAKQYGGTFGAMAKAFGFTESAAYDMSTTLTGLAGDVASFYNVSQDEAFTKLKGVFTGETEGLKSLGVVMTQSALDAYAMANGFGKTTAQMSESEKVALRYQFVLSNLSAASGDFARTSDGWANQMRVLRLQIDSIKASIGQGLIAVLTPAIRAVNALLGRIVTLANAFKSFANLITGNKGNSGSTGAASMAALGDSGEIAATGLGNAADAADNAGKASTKAGKAAKKAAKEIEKSIMGFDKINKIQAPTTDDSDSDDSADTAGGGKAGGSGIGSGALGSAVDFGSMAQGETAVDKWAKLFEKLLKICKPTTDALKRLRNEGLAKFKDFSFKALLDFYNTFLVPLGKWTLGEGLPRLIDCFNRFLSDINYDALLSSLHDLWDSLEPFAENIGDGLLWFLEHVLTPLATWTVSEVVPRFLQTLAACIDVLNAILEALKPLAEWFFESFLAPIASWTGGIFLTVWDALIDGLHAFSDWCREHQELIQTVAIIIAAFFAAWKIVALVGAIGGLISAFGTVITTIGTIIGSIGSVSGAISLLVTLLGGPVVIGIAAAIAAGVLLYKNWDKIKECAGALHDWLSEKFNAIKTAVTEAWSNTWDSIADKVNGAVDTVQGAFQSMWDGIRGVINDILGGVEGMANGVVDAVNGMVGALNGMSFDVPDWVPMYGGESFGLSLPEVSGVSIPRLANGGYVPRNSPQLAMIGDNRTQGEIVAPEGKLLELLKAAGGITKEDLESILNLNTMRILAALAEVGFYVDGKELARAIRAGQNELKVQYNE